MDSKLTAGDVRKLKADCQREIEKLEAALASGNSNPMSYTDAYLRSQLQRQQLALASLQSKPIGIVNVDARGCAANFYQLMSGGELLYTVPPALADSRKELSKVIDWVCLTCVDVRDANGEFAAQESINEIRETLERIAAGGEHG